MKMVPYVIAFKAIFPLHFHRRKIIIGGDVLFTCPTSMINTWTIREDIPHYIINNSEFSSLYIQSITSSYPATYSCCSDQGRYNFVLDIFGKYKAIL